MFIIIVCENTFNSKSYLLPKNVWWEKCRISSRSVNLIMVKVSSSLKPFA